MKEKQNSGTFWLTCGLIFIPVLVLLAFVGLSHGYEDCKSCKQCTTCSTVCSQHGSNTTTKEQRAIRRGDIYPLSFGHVPDYSRHRYDKQRDRIHYAYDFYYGYGPCF